MIEHIDNGMAPIDGPISNTVRAGPNIYSAQVPKDPATGIIVPGDITVQTRRVLDNLKLSMHAAGGSMAHVAQVLVYLTDATDMAAMNAVYAEYFTPPYPNRATCVVKALLAPGARIEMVVRGYIER